MTTAMKSKLLRLYNVIEAFGIDPRRMIYSLMGLPLYHSDLQKLKSHKSWAEAEFPLGAPYPCLRDRFIESGTARGHYFHQDLLAARKICMNNPDTHVDVGSRVDGFVAHVASFRSIEVLDIRPLPGTIPNIKFMQADLTEPLGDKFIDYCDSLSCLHALEHFGLGRYGDRVNYEGHLIGLNNLWTILKKGGKFYLSVPIGPQRIEFNAHRVFSINYLLGCLAGKYRIDEFSFVDDRGDLHQNVQITDAAAESNFGCSFGCGIFEMTKL